VKGALAAYTSAAELAAAIIAFDNATQHRFAQSISGVSRELVLCLGDAVETALGVNQNRRALSFALSKLCALSAEESARSY
jgi:hypothetical protein